MKKTSLYARSFILFSVLCVTMQHGLHAQSDIHFSQFYELSILRNPALTGVFSDNFKAAVYYRSQWATITNPFQTMMADVEYRMPISRNSNDFLSFGLLAYSDEAGDLNQKITGFYPAVNYNKSIGENSNSYLSVGVSSGYLQYSFDPSKATFDGQFQNGIFSPSNPSLETLPHPQMSLFDLGAGTNVNFSPGAGAATYVFGISGYHFTQPGFSYYGYNGLDQQIRLNVNLGMSSKLGESFSIQLHGNFAAQGTYKELVGGGLIGWHTYSVLDEPDFEVFAGLFTRYNDALIPVIKLKYKTLGIGISYDMNTSTLQKASNLQGAYEITASFTSNYPKTPKGHTTKVCPRF